jgi:hypothetical protein
MPTNYTEKNYQPLPNKEAIVHFNGKTLLTAESYLDVKAYEHALAFTVAGLMDEDLLKDVRDAVASALENGEDFRTFKQRLKPYLMSKGWLSEVLDDGTKQLVAGSNRRLKTIFSTNLQSAYSAGQWSRIQQTKEFLPYLQYMKSVSEHPRLDHKKYYGLTRKADDVIWTYIMPQNDYGCKCWVRQLTRRQAEKILEQQKQDIANGKAKPFEMEWDDYTNPKTGETTQIPTGINPSFAHNHDRLTALFKLAEDKHSTEFGERLREKVAEQMLNFASEQGVVVKTLSPILVNVQNAIALAKEEGNKTRLSEGALADRWEQYHSVKLERYSDGKHKVLVINDPADFATIDENLDPTEWQTIDFMFTLEPTANKVEFNRTFTKSDKAWGKLKDRIYQHLAKADIVPMYVKHMSIESRIKLLGFVLSLPKELQQKVVLVG